MSNIVVSTSSTTPVRITTPVMKPVQVTVPVGKPGPPGPPGEDAQWLALTQAEYDALPDKDQNTLYVIIP